MRRAQLTRISVGNLGIGDRQPARPTGSPRMLNRRQECLPPFDTVVIERAIARKTVLQRGGKGGGPATRGRAVIRSTTITPHALPHHQLIRAIGGASDRTRKIYAASRGDAVEH